MTTGPLTGASILVTRPVHQAGPLITAIEQAGGSAWPFPVMEIVPGSPGEANATAADLPAADIAIFVSPNAVQHGLHLVPAGTRLAAIGSGTAGALAEAGRPADIVPENGYDSESLLAHAGMQSVRGLNVQIFRGQDGRALLGETLRLRGAHVRYVEVYRRQPARPSARSLDELAAYWREPGIDYVIAMSEASLEYLLELLPAACLQLLPAARLVSPSARVIKTTKDRIPRMHALLAASPRANDMVAAMLTDWQQPMDESK